MRRTLFLISTLVFSFVVLSRVSAEELLIEGNGSGSTNGIVVTSGSSVVNPQTNTFEAVTTVDANANTGDNSASQNNGDVSIITGDATVKVNVNNQGNNNYSDPKPTSLPTATPVTVKPSPTVIPSSGTNSNNSSNSGTSTTSSSGSGGTGGAAVLGLSATSSFDRNIVNSLVTSLGLICLGLSLMVLMATPRVSA